MVTVTGSVVTADGIRLPASGTATIRSPMALGFAVSGYPGTSHSRAQEYTAAITACGPVDYLRCYLNPANSTLAAFPTTWPVGGSTGELADWATRGTVLSFKPDLTQFTAGAYDTKLGQLCAAYHGKSLVLILNHEPEDDVEGGTFTAAAWRAANAHLAAFVTALGRPDVQAWGCLMGYTFQAGSGRHPDDFWVPGLHGYGVDVYCVGSAHHDSTPWQTAANLCDAFTAWCDGHHTAKAWFEAGCVADFNDPSRRPAWLTGAVAYARAHGYERFSYFDSVPSGAKGDWVLRSAVHRTAYYPSALGTVTSTAPDPQTTAAWRTILTA